MSMLPLSDSWLLVAPQVAHQWYVMVASSISQHSEMLLATTGVEQGQPAEQETVPDSGRDNSAYYAKKQVAEVNPMQTRL